MDVKSNTASWSDGVANAGKWKQRYQPPPGVTVRPFVSSMADSLRPGMKLYVICTVINHGWLRLFSAVIKRVVARRQYHVHYLGFKSCHDELIAPDLIHSVIEVQGKAPVRQLQVLKVDRQLYYARFHIHYLGWAHRYDEWIAEEVIYSVVDRNTPNFNVKALKEQLSVVRPCSVDLSVNNICFFSALSKDRARVNDRRIQTLGAATASGRPAGCS
ncbi:hypothetical protein FJT64_013019 [Amphibalanus amphitrite]|uniref:Chromo domain-containing protein n=1 Tax=Amphibalanus amphitrite TaxID=1232801 RepID=A0A6A4VBH8_AMPAM|nr:hypothetical protein FJT64_013019 [Amphibalanus amphitrite]